MHVRVHRENGAGNEKDMDTRGILMLKDPINREYFYSCYKIQKFRLLFGLLCFLLMAGFFIFHSERWMVIIGLGLEVTGLVVLMQGMNYYREFFKSYRILKNHFPPGFDVYDLKKNADLRLPGIESYVYADHLFMLNKNWFYVVDLRETAWLFVDEMWSRSSAFNCLFVNTVDRNRALWIIPHLSNKETRDVEKLKPNVIYLFAYLTVRYPHIDFGYSWEKDQEFLKDHKIRRMFERWEKHDQSILWSDLSREVQDFRSILLE